MLIHRPIIWHGPDVRLGMTAGQTYRPRGRGNEARLAAWSSGGGGRLPHLQRLAPLPGRSNVAHLTPYECQALPHKEPRLFDLHKEAEEPVQPAALLRYKQVATVHSAFEHRENNTMEERQELIQSVSSVPFASNRAVYDPKALPRSKTESEGTGPAAYEYWFRATEMRLLRSICDTVQRVHCQP